MTKSQFILQIRIMVSKAIPRTGNGNLLRQIIFHETTTVDWFQVAELIKFHMPELKKKIEELEADYEKFLEETAEEERKLTMPRKTMSEIYANLDKYRKISFIEDGVVNTYAYTEDWKEGDEGIDITYPDSKPFLVVPDKSPKTKED